MNGRRLLGTLSVAASFAVGAALVRAFGPHAYAVAPPDAPLVVVDAWGATGSGYVLAAAASVLAAAAFLVYELGRNDAGRDRYDLATILTACGAALLAAGAWPFVFSSDPYAYAAYGAAAARGLDVYVPLDAAVRGPIFDAARVRWDGAYPVCAYGPAFVALARAVVESAGGDLGRALATFRVLASLAFVASAAALWFAFEPADARRRSMAVAAYALNPVAVWSAAEGHNDAYVALVALGGLASVRRGHALAGSALMTGAALLKGTALPFAAAFGFATVAAARHATRARTLVGLAAGMLLAAVVALPPTLRALRATRAVGHYAPVGSLQAAIGPAALLVALAIGAYGLFRLRLRRDDGYAWCGIAVWLALPNPYPWYAVWLLPFAVFARGAPARTLWALTISSFVRYLPDANGNVSPTGGLIVAAVALSPLAVLAAVAARRSTDRQKATSHP